MAKASLAYFYKFQPEVTVRSVHTIAQQYTLRLGIEEYYVPNLVQDLSLTTSAQC